MREIDRILIDLRVRKISSEQAVGRVKCTARRCAAEPVVDRLQRGIHGSCGRRVRAMPDLVAVSGRHNNVSGNPVNGIDSGALYSRQTGQGE